MVLHVRGVLLPEGEERDLYLVDGRVSFEPSAGAETVSSGGFVVPGLVDAHCHIGLAPDGPLEDRDGQREQAHANARAGALLVRDAGSPVDTRQLDHDARSPRLVRAGRHLARPRRYTRSVAVEVEPDELVEAVAEQAGAGTAG